MISGWILAGLIGGALLLSPNGASQHGQIKGGHATCNLCGCSTADTKVVSEYREYGHRYAVVKFRCKRCGRCWTKTYRVS
jgi:hypothetical protein